eukprot:834713-Pleurochrysis_carterae.AAC.1
MLVAPSFVAGVIRPAVNAFIIVGVLVLCVLKPAGRLHSPHPPSSLFMSGRARDLPSFTHKTACAKLLPLLSFVLP